MPAAWRTSLLISSNAASIRGRRGALAQWKHIDFKARTWTMPASHSKNGRGHVLGVGDWSLEEFTVLKRMSKGSRYVLPNANDSGPIDPKYITRSVARCLKRFGKAGIAPFTPHDLRRTGRTGLARLGVSKDVAERVLNHAHEGMEGVYDVHDYLEEKRAALKTWEGYLHSLQTNKPVLP
jgi:integrase